ncbi:hypothetical protein ACF0H5_022012 [Mactra antiquata]
MFLKVCCLLASIFVAVHGQGYASRDDRLRGGSRRIITDGHGVGHVDVGRRTVFTQPAHDPCPIGSLGPCAGLTRCPRGSVCEISRGTSGCCYRDSHSTLTSSNCIYACSGLGSSCPIGYRCMYSGGQRMCCRTGGQGGRLGRCPSRQIFTRLSGECSHARFNPRVNCEYDSECPDGAICCGDDCGVYKVCRYPV